jgi:hypothetical protein
MISKGKESVDSTFKLYAGVGSFQVIALNPGKEELQKLFPNRNIEEEPKYIGETEFEGGIKIPYVRLSFIVKTQLNDKDLILEYPLMVYNTQRVSQAGKTQVIDKYGRTCWVTAEQLANKEIPMYSNGPASIDSDYRPCFRGEDAVTDFIIAYLSIDSPQKYDPSSKKYVMRPAADLPQCECRFDNITKWFTGDVSDVKETLTYQVDNKLKLCMGVKDVNGNLYNVFYTAMPMKNYITSFSQLDSHIKSSQASGMFPNQTFSTKPLHEYTVEATDVPADAPATINPDQPWGKK